LSDDFIPIQWLGQQPYLEQWQGLQQHAEQLAQGQVREVIWGCEHKPIYTTGKRGVDNRHATHLPAPWIQTDRGGETTFHGTGQTMLYPIIHLRQRGIHVRQYIGMLEAATLMLLRKYHIHTHRREGKPGIWTEQGKIAAIGIRVSQGIAYHGMALNVNVDMRYFDAINPCGLGLKAVNLADLYPQHPPLEMIFEVWAVCLREQLLSL